MASDIAWLLLQGKKHGFAAKLSHKLDYLYRSTSGVLTQQSDLFRLTYFLETLKAVGWQNELVTQEEWTQVSANASTTTVYAAKTLLESSYSQVGQLLIPMPLRFSGDVSGIPALLKQCHLPYQRDPDLNYLAVFTLLPVIAGAGSLC